MPGTRNRSPLHALEELQSLLKAERDGMPAWLVQLRAALDAVTQNVTTEITAMSRRLGLQARFGRLDGLINNASSFYPTPVGAITEADWLDLMGTK